MMGLLRLLNLLFQIVASLSEYFRERKLIEAGEIKAKAEALEHAQEEISKAKEASSAARDKFDQSGGLPDETDPNLRD